MPNITDALLVHLIFKHCKVIYHPQGDEYPIEHNPHAKKDARERIEHSLKALVAMKQGQRK